MADVEPAKRRLTAWHKAVALLVAAWALALSSLDRHHDVRGALEDAIVRIFSGFPGAQQTALGVADLLERALWTTFNTTLGVCSLMAPLAFAARLIARARVRAGHADPLDRVRIWLAAGRNRTVALAAGIPVVAQVLYLRGVLGWGHHSALAAVTIALGAGLAQAAVLRAGLRILLAPTMGDAGEGPATIDADELRFDAVAVTRETKLAVGALALLSIATVAWIASLPILALFKDPRVFTVIASYVGVAAASAFAFRRASRIAVGVDGIYVGGTSRARFFAYRDLDEVRARGGDLELVRRGRVVLRLQLHGKDATRREAILARMVDGLARVKDVERDAAANFVTSRSVDHVVDSARGGGDYRMPSVSSDALWALVEGQGVDATTRTAAAEALVKVAGADRERLRVAAAHCADPRVRVALEDLGDEADGEAAVTAGSATSTLRRSSPT
jgi:hypothetical protein